MSANSIDAFFNQMFYDFKSVKKLLEDNSKADPENEPYKSKYAAKNILNTMLNNYKNILEDIPEDRLIQGIISHAAILLQLGMVGVDTEELNEGERYLLSCIELLTPHRLLPEVIIILLNAYNQMGLLWSNRNDVEKSKSYLIKASSLYEEFRSLGLIPLDYFDVLKPACEDFHPLSVVNLEKSYTLTLYYLAQVYGSLKDHLKSAVFCHITLKRQLELKDYDPIDWALNAATLSQYFMEKNGFTQSRHHLAAASYVIDKYSDTLSSEDTSESETAKKEQVKHRSADISRCWTKYCIGLLAASKERLMDESESSITQSLSLDFEKLRLEEENHVPALDHNQLTFDELSLTYIENQVTDQFVLTFDDARLVFLNCQKWIEISKEYYTLDCHATDYVEVIQDRSSLYRILAFFEEDERRQCAMHKRRIDLLEELIKEINPNYYGDVCRQIWFELGEIYSDLLDIKLDKLKNITSPERPSPQMLTKINHLVDNAVTNFTCFIDSIKDKSTNDIPKNVSQELLRPLLLAYFHLGRLHVKHIVFDKTVLVKNTEESLSCYKKFIEFCKEDETARNLMKAELGVCQEMVTLLPYKLIKLQKEIQNI